MLDDLVGGPERTVSGGSDVLRARVVVPPTDLTDGMTVVVPSFSTEHDYEVPAGQWMPRSGSAMPQRDDWCVLVIDADGDAWVPVIEGVSEFGGAGGADFPTGGVPGEVLTYVGPTPDDVDWSLGTPGPTGPQGLPGTTGQQGPPGPAGQVGQTGAQGIQGVKGDTGATGAQGPSGASTFMAKPGDPVAGDGADGTILLNTVTLEMWGPKASGAWPASAFAKMLPLVPSWTDVRA
jgi:hypothetical protein